MENNWLNLINLLKKILPSKEIVHYLINKEIFNRLVERKSYEFQNPKEKSNSNNLIHNYKTDGRSSKDSSH